MKKILKVICVSLLSIALLAATVLVCTSMIFAPERKYVVHWNHGEYTDLETMLTGGIEAIHLWGKSELAADYLPKFDFACKNKGVTAEEFAALVTEASKKDLGFPSLATPGNDMEAQNIGGQNEPQPLVIYSEKLDPFGHNYILYYRPATEQYDAHIIVVSRGRDEVEDIVFENGKYTRPVNGDDGYILYWFGDMVEHETSTSKPYLIDMPRYEDMTDFIIVH